jgi:hypothetical protein
MTSEFNLRVLVRDVCDSSTIPDPALLAKEVNRRIQKADRDAALEQALRVFVQNVISRARNSPGGHTTLDTQAIRATGGSTSHKVAGIRNAWRRMLQDRIAVGSDLGAWKFLRDCTAVDLDYAASIREDHARQNAARARQLRQLAELLVTHNAATVSALPDDVLGPALGAAA